MIKVVIFDLDDTLTYESDFIKSGYMHISKIIGNEYNIPSNEVLKMLITEFNNDSKFVFNNVLDYYNLDYSNDFIKKLIDEYRSHYPNMNFIENSLEILRELKNFNINIGIITDGFSVSQHNKIKSLNLREYADYIIVTDDLGREFWKPHPKAFELHKEFFAVKYSEMMYVGDNPSKDFYISNTYPIHTVRIMNDGVHSNKEYLENIKEKYLINTISDLPRLIMDINKEGVL